MPLYSADCIVTVKPNNIKTIPIIHMINDIVFAMFMSSLKSRNPAEAAATVNTRD